MPTTCPVIPKRSFPAGTPVLMWDGGIRPIEQIKIGDQVLATDPDTGLTGPRRVDATIYTPDDREFTSLDTAEQQGAGSLTITDHHFFWSENDKKWKNASDPAGGPVRITGVRQWTGLQPAYNLTVNDLHTYYVLEVTAPVLVHNTNPVDPPCDVPLTCPKGSWNGNTIVGGERVQDIANRIWGYSRTDVKRLDHLSGEELRELASYEQAVTLNQMYRDVIPQIPGNEMANPRVVLSEKVIDAWKEIM
ncbi:hypothetical protein Slala03_75810 [Streptomyces lavendulae subsp. lavendulae]|nr:hypothetical protein Slala03_75810 [Streptomyces lavendulae subsp. lavendulae]